MLPEAYRRCKFLFLANGSPVYQLKAIEQCPAASLVVADTMDHYIRNEREGLEKLLRRIDGLVLNDSEAKLLTGDDNLVRAGDAVRRMGPRFVVIKKGEHGAMFFGERRNVRPARLSHAAGGRSDRRRRQFRRRHDGLPGRARQLRAENAQEALAYGTLMASFTVEDFSLDRLRTISREDLDRRMEEYKRMLTFRLGLQADRLLT